MGEGRLERAITEGGLEPETDVRAVAGCYATILYGLSIAARDGVPVERLRSTVDRAVGLWDTLVRQAAPQP
ncbi:hypothetical protein ACWEIM_01300 [Streptomyces sp. NPDC004778]